MNRHSFPHSHAGFALRLVYTFILILAAIGLYTAAPSSAKTPAAVPPPELYRQIEREVWRNMYVPPTQQQLDWQKYMNKVVTPDDAVKYGNEVLKNLNDPYTRVLSPDQVKDEDDQMKGSFGGIGLKFQAGFDKNHKPVLSTNGEAMPAAGSCGYPLINEVIDGSPAAKSGLHAGDAIVSIDDTSAAGMSLDSVVEHIRGPLGSRVTLVILRDGRTLTVNIARANVALPAVKYKMLDGRIGYIRLSDFMQRSAAGQMMDAMKSLKSARGFIIDLRYNPGGLVDSAIAISQIFVDQGLLVTIKTRIPSNPGEGAYYEYVAYGVEPHSMVALTGSDSPNAGRPIAYVSKRVPYLANHRPVVILVNGESASAAEIMTGALKGKPGITIIGTRTFGKGIGQSLVDLPGNCRLNVTSLRYYTAQFKWLGDGNSNRVGIQPDIVAEAENEYFEPGSLQDDTQLKAAVNFLNK